MSDTARLGAALADRYRIERELGQGGMATVYLAEDVRHHRKVAVKVLHPELSAVLGPDRFLKEIELTAGLQHPHILPLFDSGTAGGLLYYVMPYVTGESLRARLAREKQLPVAEALRIADEVAGALDYAHRHGVVHRDIKPENILLHDGRALVADFGIALAVQQAGGSRMTQTGMSLGTPQYMSPEQAMGERDITPRSDIYALGCVTYEMLAGEPPFTGATAQAIVARVLTEAPRPPRTQRHTIPEHVESTVLQALEKLPADRFASAVEFAAALSGRLHVSRPGAGPHPVLNVTPPYHLTALLGALLVLMTGVAGWALFRVPASPPRPVVRYALITPPESRLLELVDPVIAIGPDGSRLAYLAAVPDRPYQLYLWNLDGGVPTAIPGTDHASWPFFSPDGEWVGFVGSGQLRRASLRGGGSSLIGDPGGLGASFRGATWTSKGEIVYATATGMSLIPAEGGAARSLPRLEGGSVAVSPDALPDGDEVLVSLRPSSGPPELAVITLDGGKVTRLGQSGSTPRYVEPGYLAFTNADGDLMAAPFNHRRRRITGPPRRIAQGISLGLSGRGQLAVSRNGTIAYLEGRADSEGELVRVDRRGVATPLGAPRRVYWAPRISPDGRRIAVTIGPHPNSPIDIWVYDRVLGTLSRVTSDSASTNPEWSADGRRILHRRANGVSTVMAVTLDGSAPPESLYATTSDLWEAIATRGLDTLITRERRSAENDRDLMLVPLKPPGPPVPWAAGARTQAEPALSPDGRWLAYSSEESGTWEVYVRAFPGPGPRYQISVGGGQAPRWNPAGGELLFLSGDSLVAVPLRNSGSALEPGRGRALFAHRFETGNYFHAPYDVAPDGTWLVAVSPPDGKQHSPTIRMVLNWFDQPWKD